MLKVYQQTIDDTVKLYNTVSSKTFKQIVKSRVYKQLTQTFNEKQYAVSYMVLNRIATRQPFTGKIRIKHLPTQEDLYFFKKEYLKEVA